MSRLALSLVACLVALAFAGCIAPDNDGGSEAGTGANDGDAATGAATGMTPGDAPVGARDPYEAGHVAPGLAGGTLWLQGEQQGAEPAPGRVVLVDFWTYSCINCIRTFDHLKAWHTAYAEHGFVLVGVHSPEFDFEKEPQNVRDAIDQYDIQYPVVMDNDYTIWKNWHNRYWPSHYLYGADGRILETHFGEGNYMETEAAIRAALVAAGTDPADLPEPVEPLRQATARGSGTTRELYAGTWRQDDTLGNGGYQPGETVAHTAPADDDDLERDRIYLDGSWFHGDEFLRAAGDGSIALRFRAGAANIVLEPPEATCLPVTLDGEPVPDDLAGGHIHHAADGTTCLVVDGPDSYDIYSGPVSEHVVRIAVPLGLDLYTFAFGSYERGGVA